MKTNLAGARVLVTGGTGFLGRRLCFALKDAFATTFEAGGRDYPLDHQPYPDMLLDKTRPDYVFHLAGYNGGISFNLKNPADIFYRNTVMGLNLLEACRRRGVKKVVSVVASCAYPEMVNDGYGKPFPRSYMNEPDFFDGPPHFSVACHGYAKRNLQLASKFYRQQYGLRAVCACPTTLYGPGDSFDPDRTKVLGALVKKFVDAADGDEQEVSCWGTGAAMREFLYVDDAAKLLLQTMENYEDSELPLNLGTGQEVSVKKLAEAVAACVEFRGQIKWNAAMPDGQIRKRLDLTRMNKFIPGLPRLTPLDEGIRRTVDYYRSLKRGSVAA